MLPIVISTTREPDAQVTESLAVVGRKYGKHEESRSDSILFRFVYVFFEY